MQLRSISLTGFKTFARQTEISFDPGVTAVVGPNGSGKSNTVDAFKWVLGEISARDLRGKRMEEIIYAGGERRAKAAAAEVTIVIDNSDHRLPVDYEEVSIRRRVDRSGSSDYFLNGSRVRRRDLLELLASTGLTTDSYAIVSQRDVDSIISSTPEQRRLLIEEAAQVRGVKAKRTEAAVQLRELAANLVRLEDLRGEIEPRLALVRVQAETAGEADLARSRLELLRGSIAWEEWREARDAQRRTVAQIQALERRLAEARAASEAAEEHFQRCRDSLQAAQDRRVQRQRALGARRLELSGAEHRLAMAEERGRSLAALAAAATTEDGELAARLEAATALRGQLAGKAARARAELAGVPVPAPAPRPGDLERARDARRGAEQARRAAGLAQAELASTRTRRQFLEETVVRLEKQVLPAEAAQAGVETAARAAVEAARAATAAASEVARLGAELEGLEALRPKPRGDLKQIGDVILARSGFEPALSAVLGPLVDAWAAGGGAAARAAAEAGPSQTTVLYPVAGAALEPGSLLDHVTCEPGFEDLGRSLLGGVVLGRDVSEAGVFTRPGLVRAGSDPRTRIAARRRQLLIEVARLEPVAAQHEGRTAALRRAQSALAEVTAAAGQRPRLDESAGRLLAARAAEADEAARLPGLERQAAAADESAAELSRSVDEHERALAEHRAEGRRSELERTRWRERVGDLERQLGTVDGDLGAIRRSRAARAERAAEAGRQAASVEASLAALDQTCTDARRRVDAAEGESPEEEAELAEAARRLGAVEEVRVDGRLKVSALEGSLGLLIREAELGGERMAELRARMPEGMAPEEVPGGRAREAEMRRLERRLDEIGPTNALAGSECVELEERYGNLVTQLGDIAAARADLEQLIARLREEEDTRYDAVFGAVAANFQEYFSELTGGGAASLRHTAGDDGPRSGVEILVQPPRKRLQNVTLLSSGERSMTALGLVLALQEINPAPFTILDEVDAALDDANVGRFGEVLQRLGRHRQFMVITHNHMTMAACAALYGVHLDESGSSHLVSVRLQDIQPARRVAQTA